MICIVIVGNKMSWVSNRILVGSHGPSASSRSIQRGAVHMVVVVMVTDGGGGCDDDSDRWWWL